MYHSFYGHKSKEMHVSLVKNKLNSKVLSKT